MVGWHHRLNGHELEQTLGDSGGQGSLVCCHSWGRKESDMTEQLNNNKGGKEIEENEELGPLMSSLQMRKQRLREGNDLLQVSK